MSWCYGGVEKDGLWHLCEVYDDSYIAWDVCPVGDNLEDLIEAMEWAVTDLKKQLKAQHHRCEYNDSGWCYAPEGVHNNSVGGGCTSPSDCPTKGDSHLQTDWVGSEDE